MKNLLKLMVVIIACVGAILVLVLGYGRSQHGGGAISAGFIGFTNRPSWGLAALLRVTNQSEHIIWCEGYGFLEPEESALAEVPMLGASEADGVWVRWQCADLTRFDAYMNRMRRRAEVFGVTPLRSPWFPLVQLSRVPLVEDRGEGEQGSGVKR